VPGSLIEEVSAQQDRELTRREHLYRDGRPPPWVRERTVILVDDGMATGASMLAAITALRQLSPGRIVAAVPVAASGAARRIGREADEFVCVAIPEPFLTVGQCTRTSRKPAMNRCASCSPAVPACHERHERWRGVGDVSFAISRTMPPLRP